MADSTLTKMRKVVHLWDSKVAQNILDEQEKQLTEILTDLGVPADVIKFDRSISQYGVSSRYGLYEWDEHRVDYDTLILHPMVEISNVNAANLFAQLNEYVDNISIGTSIRAEATIPKEDQDILWRIGKVEMHQEETPAPREVLLCR